MEAARAWVGRFPGLGCGLGLGFGSSVYFLPVFVSPLPEPWTPLSTPAE